MTRGNIVGTRGGVECGAAEQGGVAWRGATWAQYSCYGYEKNNNLRVLIARINEGKLICLVFTLSYAFKFFSAPESAVFPERVYESINNIYTSQKPKTSQ